jgi:hypothetical protein
MSSIEEALMLARRPSLLVTLTRVVTAPRFLIYCCCTLAALLTSYHLGKDVAWDTLDYHFYAGFSALHDRFGQDYFPAGAQTYLNPYVFVPFYLLAASGLTSLQAALILAAVQSVILWLVYELALAVAPPAKPAERLAIGICAVVLAFANPVLINQLGSSFADVLTAEIVIAGWLLLARTVHKPGSARVVYAALLLGCACALKLSNAFHAVCAGVIVLLIPGGWRSRLRYAALFAIAGIAGFAVVAGPWCIRLQEHFGNPFFPLFNGIFRSPQFTTAPSVDYRFVPFSLAAALWRPFAMAAPDDMIHVEWAAPDVRYALLLVVAALSLLAWGWKRRHGSASLREKAVGDSSGRALWALGLAFLADWVLWLAASGNSRYFIPMACVAAVVAVGLIFRSCSQWPKVRNYLLLAAVVAQFYQLYYGTQYSSTIPWNDQPWFQVSVPKSLATEPALYFTIGIQSNAFLAPYLASGSGLINLEGNYTLGPGGANGRHIEALIRRYSPHLRILVRDPRRDAGHEHSLPKLFNQNDALEPFGLQLDTSSCERVVADAVSSPVVGTVTGRTPSRLSAAEVETGYFISCRVVAEKARDPALVADESNANLVLDRLEDACPALFQPRRPATYLLGEKAHGYIWARQYPNTDFIAWTADGWVHFQRLMRQQGYAGPESAWEKAPLRVSCGRGADGYFLRVAGLH